MKTNISTNTTPLLYVIIQQGKRVIHLLSRYSQR